MFQLRHAWHGAQVGAVVPGHDTALHLPTRGAARAEYVRVHGVHGLGDEMHTYVRTTYIHMCVHTYILHTYVRTTYIRTYVPSPQTTPISDATFVLVIALVVYGSYVVTNALVEATKEAVLA